VDAFAIAPDQATIAYYSGGQIWLLLASEDTATSLLTLDEVNHLTFNADGSVLAYDSGGSIFALPLNGEPPQSLLSQYTDPQYSPDNSTILMRIGDGDLGLLIIATGEVRRLGAFTWGKWLSASQVAVYGAPVAGTQPGVYVADLKGDGQPQLAYAVSPGKQLVDVALAKDGNLRLLQTNAAPVSGPSAVEVIAIPLTGGNIISSESAGFIGEPVLSPDGRFIAGYASAAGNLVIYDIDEHQERVLLQPPRSHAFVWR
ncbi:MAG TPA: hypothetical protein VHL11_12730, partial [Phototrophicaceae bacterium]|nr:hypothetical protein [Phototrophicaceae bacterium]